MPQKFPRELQEAHPLHEDISCEISWDLVKKYFHLKSNAVYNSSGKNQKKEEMKWDKNKTFHWIMRWGWMTWKWSFVFNNNDDDDDKNYVQYLQKKLKCLTIPPPLPPGLSVSLSLSEIEIK